MKLNSIDLFILVFYFIIIIAIGFFFAFYKKKSENTAVDYILAGRKVSLPLFVTTLVATWYGSILGVGEFTFNSGLSAWVCFGLPYYIAALIFAFFIAGKIRSSMSETIPSQIGKIYGKIVSKVASVITLVITIPAAYMLMLGTLLHLVSDIPLTESIIISTSIALFYVYFGGMKADILANSIQFVLMFLGFGSLLYFSMVTFGSPFEMVEKLPESFLTINGELSWQYIFAWYIIAFQTFIDPSFHQKCAAAKNPKTAKNGILISIIFWIVFDTLTLMTGLYAKAFVSVESAVNTYPILADSVLPMVWKGIFAVALFAAVMSTLDSYAFLSATTIGWDIFGKNGDDESKSKSKVKYGLLATGIIGIILATVIPSVVDLIYITASIASPGLIPVLTISYFPKFKLASNSAFFIIITGSLASLVVVVIQKLNFINFQLPEPIFVGLIFSIAITALSLNKTNETNS